MILVDSQVPKPARTSPASSHYDTARHRALIAELVANGWRTRGWRADILKRMAMRPWCGEDWMDYEEIRDRLPGVRITPDAFRISLLPQRDYPALLVLDMVEVVVTHGLTKNKTAHYLNLWWDFDGSDRCHLRVWTVDVYGRWGSLLDGTPFNVEHAIFPELFRAAGAA